MKKKKLAIIAIITLLAIMVILESSALVISQISFKEDAKYIQQIEGIFVKVQNENVDLTHIIDKAFNNEALTDQDSIEYQKLVESNNAVVEEYSKFLIDAPYSMEEK